MNRMKLLCITLASLMIASAIMSGCESVCSHIDNDKDGKCDLCRLDMTAETQPATADDTASESDAATETEAAVSVTVSLTVADQDGLAISDAVLLIKDSRGEEAATVTTDAEGKASVTLAEGAYSVIFDSLPEYHVGGTKALTVTDGMKPVALEVINNTPDGSKDHPLVLNEAATSVSCPAGVTLHFSMFAGDRRSLVIHDAEGVELTVNGVTHTPDESGTIRASIAMDNPQSHPAVTLTSATAQDLTILIESEPGSTDNPIVIDALDTDITAQVKKDVIMYYTFTAKTAGKYAVTCEDTSNNISLTNRTNSVATEATNGKTESAKLTVEAGDVISVAVSYLGQTPNGEPLPMTFRLVLSAE